MADRLHTTTRAAAGTNLIDVQLTIDNTLGACLVGFAVSCIVYGILLSMVFTYFQRYPSDRPVYKGLVYLLLVLETADQAFIGHLVYFYTISNFANPVAVIKGNVTWSFIMQLLVGLIAGWIVKTAFAMRVWRFSERNIWITGLCLILAWGDMAVGLVYSVKAFLLPTVFDVAKLRVLGTIALGIGVLTDIIVASSLCYYLNKLRTGYVTSDSLVRILTRFAINTGVVTSAVSLSTLILYNLMPSNNLIFVAVYFLLNKLYAISFLATLNTRRVVRGRGTDRNGSSHRTSNLFQFGTRMPSMGNALELDNWTSTKESALTSPVGKAPSRAELHLESVGYAAPVHPVYGSPIDSSQRPYGYFQR